MPQTLTTSLLHGEPMRIWSALTDPDHRSAWRPLILLDNPARLGDTECTFVIEGWSQPIRSPGRIDLLDKPRAYAWSCGIPYLFRLEERYELTGDDGGTQVTHRCTLRGALSYPVAPLILRRLHWLMIEADERLASYLRRQAGLPGRGISGQRVPVRNGGSAR